MGRHVLHWPSSFTILMNRMYYQSSSDWKGENNKTKVEIIKSAADMDKTVNSIKKIFISYTYHRYHCIDIICILTLRIRAKVSEKEEREEEDVHQVMNYGSTLVRKRAFNSF